MGNFYVNITTKGPDNQSVVNYIKENNYTAYVSPTINNVTTIYETICDTQMFNYISDLLKDISETLNCVAIAMVNHDDDFLAYEIYEAGKIHHEYDSSPESFNDTELQSPSGGDAKYLCRVFGVEDNESRVEKILMTNDDSENGYIFEIERHKDLWKALNLPPYAVGIGFNYISEGEIPEGLTQEELIEINK